MSNGESRQVVGRDKFGGKIIGPDGQPVMVDFEPRFTVDTPLLQNLERGLLKIPGAPTLMAIAGRANANVLGVVDYLGVDVVNEIIKIAGSESRVPSVSDSARKVLGIGDSSTELLGEGLLRDVVTTGTDLGMVAIPGGAAIRAPAKILQPIAKYAESTGRGILRQLGQGTVARDISTGFVSGAARELGEATEIPVVPQLMEFLAPMLLPSTIPGAPQAVSKIKDTAGAVAGWLDNLFTNSRNFSAGLENLSSYTKEGAERILYDSMLRSGKTVDELVGAYELMLARSTEVIPADVDDTFRAYLRAIGNKVPVIMGRSRQVLDARDSRQAERLSSTLDSSIGVPGLSAADEIIRLDAITRPTINAAYREAQQLGSSGFVFPSKIERLLGDPKTSLGRARAKADQYARDAVLLGQNFTHFDLIDATKKELDDQIGKLIRAGRMNRARSLIQQKKLLVMEADKAFPGYAKARQLHADKAALEGAADAGINIRKLKPRDVRNLMDTMGEAEQRMFRLGARDSIIERMNDTTIGANAIRSIYRSPNERTKLRMLFPRTRAGQKAFDDLIDNIEMEGEFRITRTAAKGNSTTALQLETASSMEDAFNIARGAMGDPFAQASLMAKVFNRWSNKGNPQAQIEAYTMVGDILLSSGYSPEKLQNMLRAGADQALSLALTRTVFRNSPRVIQGIKGMGLVEMFNFFTQMQKDEQDNANLQSQLPD